MVLPDVLASGLDIVFCGTAAGAASARAGAYYAGPGNRFWRTLREVGLTPREFRPDEFRRLLECRIGLTDLAKHASGSDASLPRDSFDRGRLVDLIRRWRPRAVAFTGKRAATEFLGRKVDYGRWPQDVEGAALHVLPSPSGLARRFWSIEPWRLLAADPRRRVER
jgi:TDG/mug DNA glycosylase family protein